MHLNQDSKCTGENQKDVPVRETMRNIAPIPEIMLNSVPVREILKHIVTVPEKH